jgi:hypothetical protein
MVLKSPERMYQFLIRFGQIVTGRVDRVDEDALGRVVTYSFDTNDKRFRNEFWTKSNTVISIGDNIIVVSFGEISFII